MGGLIERLWIKSFQLKYLAENMPFNRVARGH